MNTNATKFKVGDPVYSGGNPGIVLEVLENDSYKIQLDWNRLYDKEPDEWAEVRAPRQGRIEEDEGRYMDLAEYTTLDRLAVSGTDPVHSPYGYVIMEDGTIHTLIQQWVHGMVCAMLFPDLAKESGYRQPDKESSVYHYQRFELDYHNQLPVIRIAFGMLTPVAVSKSKKAATPAQIDAARRCLLAAGRKMNDTVSAEFRDMTVANLLKELAKDED